MFYRYCARPFLFQADPETVHDAVQAMGKWIQQHDWALDILHCLYAPRPFPALSQQIWGLPFHNPIGLAAGFDKNATLLRLIQAIGFGFMEIGSVSAKPWPGNPKPRLFRLQQDHALINRMGLLSEGVQQIFPRLEAFADTWPVGVNLVKTPDPSILGEKALNDFADTLRRVVNRTSYLTFNISCPNTAEGKTFEDPHALAQLLCHLRTLETEHPLPPKPWCLKISPDIEPIQLEDLFAVGCEYRIRGWVVSNTTTKRFGLNTPTKQIQQIGMGGLSGRPLRAPSTETLAKLYQLARKQPVETTLIGVGGIDSVESAWEKITHGASLLQLYTGLIYEGPGLLRQLQHGLHLKLKAHGFQHLSEAVGSNL